MSQLLFFQEEEEEEEDKDVFFDSRDDISSSSGSCPDSPSNNVSSPQVHTCNLVSFDQWIKEPESIKVRRENFMRLLGLDSSRIPPSIVKVNTCGEFKLEDAIKLELDRTLLDSSAELVSSSTENKYSMSNWSSEVPSTSYDDLSEQNFIYSFKNLDDGTVFVVDEVSKDGTLKRFREVGSNKTLSVNEFEKNFGPSPLVLQLMRRDSFASSNSDRSFREAKVGVPRRLGVAARIIDKLKAVSLSSISNSNKVISSHSRRVKVGTYKKHFKELSAVYKRQDIKAHDGAILTMKFSQDGQYLATGGEDGVIRIWHVFECNGRDAIGVVEHDPSCIYFIVNDNSELVHLHPDREKKSKSIGMKKMRNPMCIIPSGIFQLSQDPIHEFHGHGGDVLDLSWSNSKFLLSSSIDKTVRLWRVGSESCLKVFSHKDYVTCVHFNPVDENHFISGSIDGKVRIWNVPASCVVDWVDIREIVTAVCYQPDGKRAVVGTMIGDCRFYDASDNHLELKEQISLQANKKPPLRRITGFQFCPTDHRKLMVTSADSQIRILYRVDRIDVISKYKGIRNSGSQIYASFTSDGQHIISASEDSNVYIWNHVNVDSPASTRVTSSWSSESFFSRNVSIAIPWHGVHSNDQAGIACGSNNHLRHSFDSNTLCLSPSGSFTRCHDVLSEILPKGLPTWPEEKLRSTVAGPSTMCKSHRKALKGFCQNTSHTWGLVVVTAGWDGWIRSYQNYGLPVNKDNKLY